METLEGNIDLLVGHDGTTITIRDGLSSKPIIQVKLTPEQLSQALSRQAYTPCTFEYFHANHDKIGKKMENKHHSVKLPPELSKHGWRDNKEALDEFVLKNTPEGWIPDLYYGSQNSFYWQDEEKYVRFIIRRYV